MAETQPPTPATPKASSASPSSNGRPPKQKRGPPLHQIYALPVPIRTFPLPTFYPNNPVSLFHIAYAWLRQVIRPPPAEPAVIHHGTWSASTTSVHVTDEKSMKALWEQGFYGKGSLSRSEPNWLKREQLRKGLERGQVSEVLTVQRRQERSRSKWERARAEQEAIRQTRLEESRQTEGRRPLKVAAQSPRPMPAVAPVGPMELLALPNSVHSSGLCFSAPESAVPVAETARDQQSSGAASAGPLLPDPVQALSDSSLGIGGIPNSTETPNDAVLSELSRNGSLPNGVPPHVSSPVASSDSSEAKILKRQKSVRFSPKVESTTFELSDPPSPNSLVLGARTDRLETPNGAVQIRGQGDQDASEFGTQALENKEHLQLMPEEAFFLTFGLGVLAVTDPASGARLSPKELLTLFRQHSYFPPRDGPDDPDLQPDDKFLVHYAVYHHFRSLGWVPRAGIKFGVDWLLYTRGPVFDHAEYGVMVLPSYSDPWWKASGKGAPPHTWQWMHSIVRVLSHVMKQLVLVYVDVPPPPKLDAGLEKGFTEALGQYTVREVMVKRWSSNRNR